MRLVLFLAVLALGADALYYSGAHTQALYEEISTRVEELTAELGDGTPTRDAERAASAGEN
jgi:outer membrane murein-binding lipoprotein Lpp